MSSLEDFGKELKKKNLGGLWETLRGEEFRVPESCFEPCLWKWNDVHDALENAGRLIGIEAAFRRAIQLCNPALGRNTTHTLQLNVQLLRPGEHAPAHRHTFGAIRFIVAGRGAHCVVNGESFEIGAGDFITTPSWCWHDHIGDSDDTMIWLDGLDGPLVRLLQVGFWEPYKQKKQPIARAHGSSSVELSAIRASWIAPQSKQPPAYCYRWRETEQTLKTVAESPGDPFDGIVLDFVNPLNGGPTLPTFSCAIQMLRPGELTRVHRHTSTAIYHVFKGSGTTVIDGKSYSWQKGDSFVVPLWRNHKHENRAKEEAVLFVMSDKPALEAFGYYREEAGE